MTVSGNISSRNSGEIIPGANVFISDSSGTMLVPAKGTATDANDHYSIDVPTGTYITATYVGHSRQTKQASGGSRIDFVLDPAASASLPVVETSENRPFNWKLWTGLALLGIGAAYFIYDIVKTKSNA